MDCWKKKEPLPRSIGIAGSIRGSGATHLAVALANYAASGQNERAACPELGASKELARWKEAGKDGCFKEKGVSYYPNVKREQIPILLNRSYEKILMDFSDDYSGYREELLRCGRKIFLLNLNPWQAYAARELLEEIQSDKWGNIRPVFASLNPQKMVKNAIEQEFKIQVISLPLIPDPFRIRPETFACMDFLSGGLAAKYKRRNTLLPIFKKS